MRRDSVLTRLAEATHDLVVVGGGIHGAWAAWDATLRGLTVALVDQGEFGGATSANSLRIVHGGLRYLARGDVVRMRESIRERTTLLRIAPTFVAPLPVLVPTYRHGSTGHLAFGAALLLNDLFSWRRNRGLPPECTIPRGRLVSPSECRQLFPAVNLAGLTGGAVWHDGHLLDPEGLIAAIVGAAERGGATAASYIRVNELLTAEGAACGVRATDGRTGVDVAIRARAVLVAAGPWGRAILERSGPAAQSAPKGVAHHSPRGHTFAINIRLRRRLAQVAVGLHGCGRYFFLVPDGESMLAGTWYALPRDSDERALVARGGQALLDELSTACRAARLSPADVIGYQSGWLPLQGDHNLAQADDLAERPCIAVLSENGGPERAVLVEGVKYTTARRVAECAVDRILTTLGRPRGRCRTAEVAL